jgi:hypothetical protein
MRRPVVQVALDLIDVGMGHLRTIALQFVASRGTEFSTPKLHKRLHIHRTFDVEQVDLNEKAPTCGAFAEPSDGLEPSTPSLPLSDEAGSAGTAGKPRARKPRKKKESPEEE